VLDSVVVSPIAAAKVCRIDIGVGPQYLGGPVHNDPAVLDQICRVRDLERCRGILFDQKHCDFGFGVDLAHDVEDLIMVAPRLIGLRRALELALLSDVCGAEASLLLSKRKSPYLGEHNALRGAAVAARDVRMVACGGDWCNN
jgi:hypothetical protein